MTVHNRVSFQAGTKCTAQLPDGGFCDKKTLADAPFPICAQHGQQAFMFMYEHLNEHMHELPRNRLVDRMRFKERLDEFMRETNRQHEVVYYLFVGDAIKIGTTKDLRHRLSQLRRVNSDVLAMEPGSFELESMRHRQFDHLRIGGRRREDFEDCEELRSHIKMLVDHFGEPDLDTKFAPTGIGTLRARQYLSGMDPRDMDFTVPKWFD